MTISSYKGDSVVIDVTVKEDGVAKDITGATVDAAIQNPIGTITGVTSAITDAANGVVQVQVPTATMNAAGTWTIELEVVIGSESQTVYQEEIDAADALLVD